MKIDLHLDITNDSGVCQSFALGTTDVSAQRSHLAGAIPAKGCYAQFAFAVRLEAAWILTLAGFREVPSDHNSVALRTPESSSTSTRKLGRHYVSQLAC
jgi:hypothetical protein